MCDVAVRNLLWNSMADRLNLLGMEILGTNFDLDIKIFRGSVIFVCCEVTTLTQSVQTERGMPTLRPPYPAKRLLKNEE